ncbi:MAG: aromatic ring-hydroxylating dioxygenase subunit alpha [Betaproteobacteria bacterium]|nr:aromatic ring-hydroxylating dioxygenase subunit alpha [Betaproteobacteria bacterium]
MDACCPAACAPSPAPAPCADRWVSNPGEQNLAGNEKRIEATQPYSGYVRRAATRENTELTHVEKGSPCGEYLRRFWQPVALSSDLKDIPVAVELLCEKLVLFRDKSGRLGLLDRHCSHRGMSLEFGLIGERGLQCGYHGWHYDVDGRILDIPGMPDGQDYRTTFTHGAYPVREFQGIVFTYLGPPEHLPQFPVYDFMQFPEQDLHPVRWHSPCNWLQVRENTQDPIHTSFLHTMFGVPQFGPWFYDLPVIQWAETPVGQVTVSARHTHGHLYARVNELILPNYSRVPEGSGHSGDKSGRYVPSARGRGMSFWVVPLDNVNCVMTGWFHFTPDQDAALRERIVKNVSLGQYKDRPEEERARYPGDYDAWVSQGPIAIHANEHLCRSDGAVALYRTQLRKGIRAVQEGRDPKGLFRTAQAPIQTYASNMFEEPPAALEGDVRNEALVAFGQRSLDRTLALLFDDNPKVRI